MGEMGELYRAMKEDSRERKERNRVNALKVLGEENIKYESKNDGVHFVVDGPHGLIDYWPTTGKWVERAVAGLAGRGVSSLVNHVKRHR